MPGEKKKKTAAQQRATAKYEQANYDKVLVRFPKGIKDEIKQYNNSVNGYIVNAVKKQLDKDKTEKEFLNFTLPDLPDLEDMPFK